MKKFIRFKWSYLVIFAFVFINVFLFNSFSPIHSMMNLQYDQMLFCTIGKGIKYGKIPYLDMIDHKGIYLFMFYALGYFICEYKHIGMFILTLIINYLDAIIAYKTALLILNNLKIKQEKLKEYMSILVSCFIIFILNTYYICVGGLDCEATFNPLIMLSFYLFLKYLFSNENKHPLQYMFIYGITAGIILFSKPNSVLMIASIGLFLLVDLIIKKEWKNLVNNVLVGALGVIIAVLPGIIYCIITNSLFEMLEQTFIVNMRYIGTGYADDRMESFLITLYRFTPFVIMCMLGITGLMILLKKQNLLKNNFRVIIFYFLSLIIGIYVVFMAFRPYTHYLTVLIVYFIPLFIFFIVEFYNLFDKCKIWKIVFIVIIILLQVLSYGLNLEISLMNGSVQSAMANKIKRVYKEHFGNSRDCKVLAIRGAMYTYEALGLLPAEKCFVIPAVRRKYYEKPYEDIIECVDSKREDLIITAYDIIGGMDDEEFKNRVTQGLNKGYQEIARLKDFTVEVVMYKKVSDG